ncbi:TPA: AAA family ATPase [Providencia rettgeri]|nr:AAA family ATPase [Providencia rettgeri]
MKIKLASVKIIGFKSHSKIVEVAFSSGGYSVIYGGNGSGKTTFLKLMHAILNKDSFILNDNNVSKVNIGYFFCEDERSTYHEINIDSKINEKKVIEFESENGTILEHVFNEAYTSYDWSEYDSSHLSKSKSLFLGVERGISTNTKRITYKSILNFIKKSSPRSYFNNEKDAMIFAKRLHQYLTLEKDKNREIRDGMKDKHLNLQELKMEQIEDLLLEMYFTTKHEISLKIQNALFETLSIAIDRIEKKEVDLPTNFYSNFLENKNRIIEALESNYTGNDFSIKFTDKVKAIETIEEFEAVIKNDIFKSLVYNMIRETQQEKKLLSPVNTLIDIFNRYLNNKPFLSADSNDFDKSKYISITENRIRIISQGDKGSSHNINSLSSGEKHILVFLSMIITVGADRDFIFIDEPELSLNIIWVRELMDTLKILAPSSQMIVASHSPIIARDNPSALVKLNVSKLEGRES